MTKTYKESDILAVYTRDISRYKVLAREDEKRVGRAAMANDGEARQELVRANLRFVINVAKRYRHRGISLMDLIQAGNIGLTQAAKRFDPSRDNRFITYAVFWIRQAIAKEIDANHASIGPTQTQMVRVRRIRRLQYEARQRLGRDLTVAELVRETGFTRARVTEAVEFRPLIVSLDAPVNPADDRSPLLSQTISYDDGREGREEMASLAEATAKVLRSVLSARECEIIEEYFGLGRPHHVSLTQIGAMRGISRERARQLKDRALRKLKAAVEYHPFLLEHFAAGHVRPSNVAHSLGNSGDSHERVTEMSECRGESVDVHSEVEGGRREWCAARVAETKPPVYETPGIVA